MTSVAHSAGARQSPDPRGPTTARTATARTARSRRTRAALTAAERAELNRSGSVTADDVAANAGCSTATFYSHFATKDDALTAAFESVLDDLATLSGQLLDIELVRRRGLSSTIADMVDGQARFFRTEALIFRSAIARLPEHRPLRELYRAAESASLDRLCIFVAEGQRLDLLRPGNTRVMAETLLVLSQGINNPRVLRPDAGALRDELAQAIIAVLTDTSGGRS